MNYIKQCGQLVAIVTLLSSMLQAQDLKKGPFEIETIDKRHYLIVADSILNRDIVVDIRVAKGATSTGGFNDRKMFHGSQLNQTVVRFVKNQKGQLQIKEVNYRSRVSGSNEGLSNSVELMNSFPVIAQFEIQPSGKAATSKVDFTDLLLGDKGFMGVAANSKSFLKLESLQPEKSSLIRSERFPEGMDIRLAKTYTSEGFVRSIELNASFLLLPKDPYTPRLADDRVVAMGFNTEKYTDFGDNPLYSVQKRLSYRYRLEPHAKDRKDYLKGKLVEPVKPIVFYLDPNIPKEWIPYFKKGITMWEKTFERAGFKNALKVEMAPASEAEFNFLSARYNTIDYLPSETYGGSADITIDKRSGEVIYSRIRMPHSNPGFHRNRYMVLAGALDTGARKAQFSIDLSGEISASVVAHELGHCLGIHHNYLSSALVPVEKLRDKKWVEKNGFSPSIMDYSRHNYVAQPEDKVGREGLIPKVGAYDYWAIEWLYTWYEDQDPAAEKKKLNALYNKKVKADPLTQYINNDWYLEDYRLQMEDVGDDPVTASTYGLKNIRYIVPYILEWTQSAPGMYDYDVAQEVYTEVLKQYRHFMQHVSNLVGGSTLEINENNSKKINGWVSKEAQKKAIDFLGKELLHTPDWLLHAGLESAFSNRGLMQTPMEKLIQVQSTILANLLDQSRLIKMKKAVLTDPEQYSSDEMLTDLEGYIFSEWDKGEKISYERRMLQNNYVKKVAEMIPFFSRNNFLGDERMVFNHHLKVIRKNAETALGKTSDSMSNLHIQQLVSDIDEVLKSSRKI